MRGNYMWYLVASYNNKNYNLGAGLNRDFCAQMMIVYNSCFDPDKVKFKVIRLSELPLTSKELSSQSDFIKHYKIDHFMVAYLETQDVAARFEC